MSADTVRGTYRDATVLVVDDEPQITELYGEYLKDKFTVHRATGGREALEKVDEYTDVVLLDRRMPEVDGDEVLEAIRERGLDCRVVMVTAISPDFDIIDMAFDDYLTKPASESDVVSAVENQLLSSDYDTRLKEYHRIRNKIDVLEDEKTVEELDDNDSYQMLTVLEDSLRDELEEMVAEHDDLDVESLEPRGRS